MISPESEFAMHPELNTFVADKVKYYVDGVGPVAPTGEVIDTVGGMLAAPSVCVKKAAVISAPTGADDT